MTCVCVSEGGYRMGHREGVWSDTVLSDSSLSVSRCACTCCIHSNVTKTLPLWCCVCGEPANQVRVSGETRFDCLHASTHTRRHGIGTDTGFKIEIHAARLDRVEISFRVHMTSTWLAHCHSVPSARGAAPPIAQLDLIVQRICSACAPPLTSPPSRWAHSAS